MKNNKSWTVCASTGLNPVVSVLCFILLMFTQAATAFTTLTPSGSWEPAVAVNVVKGSRFYDTSERVYYTVNTLTNSSAEAVTGPLRLLVTNSSHTVKNADGDDAGQPYFTILTDGETLGAGEQRQVTIKFQPRRARFSYQVAAQVFVAVTDSDGDGIPDEEDLCPNDPDNACFTISGEVYGGGAALSGAAVKIGLNSVNTSTDPAGRFEATNVGITELTSDNLNQFFPVQVQANGYSSGYAKAVLIPGTTNYHVIVNLDPVSDQITEEDDLSEGVPIQEDGQTVGSLRISPDALPDGVSQVTGTVTYLDPAADLNASPGGDLLALPENSDPNSAPVPLETYGMMEFDLRDQNGNEIHQLNGDAEVCMAATSGLQQGDVVPLWYYDETRGLWIEEGQGTVESRDGQLMICGNVTHFTWWNYDQPINTHSCFKYKFVDETSGEALAGALDWSAEGVTYNGRSPERACNRDGNDPVTGGNTIDGLTVKKSTTSMTEQIRVFTHLSGVKYYLVHDGDGTYSLSQNVNDAAVFDNPQDQGSCLSNQNVENCAFLDYMDAGADGVLPLSSDINYPPVISDFVIENQHLLVDQSTNVSATVTDPEGSDVTIAWTSSCWSANDGELSTTSGSGSSPTVFNTFYTAPSSVDGFGQWCQITIEASDAEGNTSTADQWFTVSPGSFLLTIEGTLYGTDGNPLPDTLLEYYNYDCDLNSLNQSVTTDGNGYYRFDVDLTGCLNGYEGEGSYYGANGQITVSYSHNGQSWSRYEELYFQSQSEFGYSEFDGQGGSNCSTLPFGESGLQCQHDIHLPVVWGPLQGALLDNIANLSINADLGSEQGWSLDWHYLNGLDGAASYGPIEVPVGRQISLNHYDSNTGTSTSLSTFMPSTDGFQQDFGASGSGAVTVTVLDDQGNPVPAATVNLYSWSSGSTSSQQDTNSSGQVTFSQVSLGRFLVWTSNSAAGYLSSGGVVSQNNETVLVDLGSQQTCEVIGTAYDWNGQPLADTDISLRSNWWNNYSQFTTTTTDSGEFVFSDVVPGDVAWWNDQYYEFYSVFVIPNCRPNNGAAPQIRLDRPPVFDFGGSEFPGGPY